MKNFISHPLISLFLSMLGITLAKSSHRLPSLKEYYHCKINVHVQGIRSKIIFESTDSEEPIQRNKIPCFQMILNIWNLSCYDPGGRRVCNYGIHEIGSMIQYTCSSTLIFARLTLLDNTRMAKKREYLRYSVDIVRSVGIIPTLSLN